MQALTEEILKLGPPGGVFDETVVCNVFPRRSEGARRAALHRAVQSGEVLRLKRGLFCLDRVFRRTHPHPFALAALLHSPSHISRESALWHHGLIPEAVHEVTCVTSFRSRHFDTPQGRFSFLRVPTNDPRAGVRAVRLDENSWSFVATPLRAIADLVYARREITWNRDGPDFLTDSLRIDLDELMPLDLDDAEAIGASLRNKRTRAFIEGLTVELTR